MFRLEFEPTQAVGSAEEIVRTCRQVADRIERVGIDFNDSRPVHDENGNKIGEFVLTSLNADVRARNSTDRGQCPVCDALAERDAEIDRLAKRVERVEAGARRAYEFLAQEGYPYESGVMSGLRDAMAPVPQRPDS